MSRPLTLHPDVFFSSNTFERDIARRLYRKVSHLPIISPHGHTDPRWFAQNKPFANPSELLIQPDHYIYRMLYSQGISLDALGIPKNKQSGKMADPEQVWKIFAENFHLFRGTPSYYWLNYVFVNTFGIDIKLNGKTAEHYYQIINDKLTTDAFLPRALFEKYNIEVLATTECPTDNLQYHQQIKDSGWSGKVITAFRPDAVIDAEHESFLHKLNRLSEISGLDCLHYPDYIEALSQRRTFFKKMGATSTDHGHPTANTADISDTQANRLFNRLTHGTVQADDAELFRSHMLFKMAEMSIDDGLVMQIHPGCYRNHNKHVFNCFGRDKGADLPNATHYTTGLKPLLDKYGNDPRLNLILFTLDETNYSRELGPLAGHYPCLKLGPPWWFHDSPEGMSRFRRATTEVAGFYNTVGFNDDTRAFLSIPARHDLSRRMDCAYLAELVAKHQIDEYEALQLATDLSYNLIKSSYKL
ncbi:glucuronate isomerase [Aliiglaciecola sp. 3_MG-2023]|uniref:glucuronate isomerase n=1 Tax=Aliiglaciecola sp. 3_MG-2023 TaxID=3062644 RepID=UPI0026E11855|nr:glucuronate isomerase [Aliiglaciecola sp. 3_MG-2023]MDO6693280.1 glucuronate isomerase [Aliiglaciecola sp. 3_MG-2023]